MDGEIKGRIILADDEAMMRQFLKTILVEYGYRIVGEAGTGSEAVKLCKEQDADLVCLDIQMPGSDGISALKEIHAERPELPVVMVSGESTQEHVKEAIAAGALGFIAKPFNANLVVERVELALARSRKAQASSSDSGQPSS